MSLSSALNEKRVAQKLFYSFLALQLLLWTVLPSLLRRNLPIDTIEGLTWGHEWQLGYDKNPFVNAWLSEIITKLFGVHDWPFYFAGQLCVVICFWGVWRLANKMLTPFQALVGVLMLEGVYYFTLNAQQFGDNLIELPLWSLLILFFYHALKKQDMVSWGLVGIFAGLAMMTKYYAFVLFVPMLVAMFYAKRNGFAPLSYPNIAIAAVLFFMCIAPHFIWLMSHHYITIKYALVRVGGVSGFWESHVGTASNFAVNQILIFLPALLIYAPLFLCRRSSRVVTAGNRRYVWLVGVGPFVLTLLLSVVFGWRLHVMWGTPLLSLWGVIWLSLFRPEISVKKIRQVYYCAIAVMILLAVAFTVEYAMPNDSRAFYPGRQTAAYATQLWHERYHTPLRYVAGPRWEAGNIAFYSPDRPHVYMNWDSERSTWINTAQLRQSGALFVWDPTESAQLPAAVRQRFPTVQLLKPHVFERPGKGTGKVTLNFAILPPE